MLLCPSMPKRESKFKGSREGVYTPPHYKESWADDC